MDLDSYFCVTIRSLTTFPRALATQNMIMSLNSYQHHGCLGGGGSSNEAFEKLVDFHGHWRAHETRPLVCVFRKCCTALSLGFVQGFRQVHFRNCEFGCSSFRQSFILSIKSHWSRQCPWRFGKGVIAIGWDFRDSGALLFETPQMPMPNKSNPVRKPTTMQQHISDAQTPFGRISWARQCPWGSTFFEGIIGAASPAQAPMMWAKLRIHYQILGSPVPVEMW